MSNARLAIFGNSINGAMDRLARPILVGDELAVALMQTPIVQVMEITPQLDRHGPQGHLVHCVGSFALFVPAGQAAPDIIIVRRKVAGEAKDGEPKAASQP